MNPSLDAGARRRIGLTACCLAAMLTGSLSPIARAGTLYRCVGDDGVATYTSKRIRGSSCNPVHPARDTSLDPVTQPAMPDTPATPSSPRAIEPGLVQPSDPVVLSPPAADSGATFQDFGDPNAAAALAKLQQSGSRFRYVQIGDSHTAGDFLTEQLRSRLQARLGDGGIGWAMPMRVPGQRLARVRFEHEGWALVNSRNAGAADYPFGGLLAQVASDYATLTVEARQGSVQQDVTVLIRQSPQDASLVITDAAGRQQWLRAPVADGRWHVVGFQAWLPFNIRAQRSQGTAIGGWWLSAPAPGATVSAVGINGAELSQWNRWRNNWMDDLDPSQPDVIALAYGTNEAFKTPLDEAEVRDALATAIEQLRRHFPRTAILVIGAPESLSSVDGGCGRRAPALDAVQRIQRDVARRRRTLFWDWQGAMGGACSMKRWIGQGWAREDGVHFSAIGYARLGDALYQELIDAARSTPGR